MQYELFVAKRYFRSKRRTGFISLINYFSIAGVTIGVAALIIVLSVMNGFENEVRTRIIGFDAHVRFRGLLYRPVAGMDSIVTQLRKLDHIKVVSPYVFNKAFISHSGSQEGIYVKGVDPATVADVTELAKNIVYGELNFSSIEGEDGKTLPGIVLGKTIALKLDLDLGDKIWVTSLANLKPTYGLMPTPYMMAFRVTGYFETGLHDYDDVFALVSLEAGQKLFKMGETFTGCEIKLDNMKYAHIVKQDISNRWGYKYVAETWRERNRNLFTWMYYEKIAAFVVLSLIITVAAFNIISTLIMVVMDKKRDIGILKSMGASSKGILKIFVLQGMISGIIGSIVGCLLGFVLCWSQLHYKWFALDASIYWINSLPIKMQILDFVFIFIIALAISFAATLFPAWKAAQLDPVESIRYE